MKAIKTDDSAQSSLTKSGSLNLKSGFNHSLHNLPAKRISKWEVLTGHVVAKPANPQSKFVQVVKFWDGNKSYYFIGNLSF